MGQNSMKVVILCTQLEGGGAQRASFKLSREFNKRGIIAENWFLYKKRDNYTGLGTIKICLNRPIKSVVDYVTISYNYYKYLKQFKPDAVIAFTHYANVLGLIIAYLAGVKIRVASHRNPSWGDMSGMLIKLDNFFAKHNIYTGITAVSESTKKTFSYYPPKVYNKLAVIKNGLDFSVSNKSKAEARASFNLPESSNIIGTIGRLSKQKNQQLLINAIVNLDQVCLAIVGDGELKQELEELVIKLNVEHRVFLLGEINYDQIPEFLTAIDVYVMPSLFEGLSNALVEAMSMGVPVISSDVDSQRDVVISEDGVSNGILLPVDNSQLWSDTIAKLLNDSEKMVYFSKRSEIRAADFTIKKMADGFLQVIDDNR